MSKMLFGDGGNLEFNLVQVPKARAQSEKRIYVFVETTLGQVLMTALRNWVTVQGCFLSGVVAFVLSAALSSSFVQAASASAHVNSYCLASGINPDGTPIYPPQAPGAPYPSFTTEDEQVYVWMNVTLDERMNITAQWCFLNGSIYHVERKTRNAGSWLVWFSLRIKGHPPAQVREVWKVNVLADDTHLFAKRFGIVSAPTFLTNSPFAVAVVIIIAVPALMGFSMSKRPPPKFGFASLLVGGLLVAISGFFRGALGGSMWVFSSALYVFILFNLVAAVLIGAAIAVSALRYRGVVTLALSALSLLYFAYFYYVQMQGSGGIVAVPPFVLTVTGGICGLLGGLLIRRRT